MFWLLSTDRYIRGNIRTIDKADSIYIVTEDNSVSYPFDEEVFKFVSYGGFVVKVDNFFVALFAPYSNKLTKIDMNIRYTKGESTLATADIYHSNENSEEYFSYLNNVYWSTHSKLTDLLGLIE
ncbi:MAG: hypothetical protein GX376_05215 [Firmicutes bacterium]|nr:hypothetical protein [Bacillota bacterium]